MHEVKPKHVGVEVVDGVATITLRRPVARNALCEVTLSELLIALLELGMRASPVDAVVLLGEGEVFCSGGDVLFFEQLLSLAPEQRQLALQRYIGLAHEVVLALVALPCPVIAGVQGAAAGFGMSLACHTDLIVAAEGSLFVPAYSMLGTSPDGGLSHTLPQLIGAKRALELLLVNGSLDAQQALSWGLVSQVVAKPQLASATAGLACRLARGAKLANRETKTLLCASRHEGLKEQLDRELQAFLRCSVDIDFEEGVRGFLQKRAPVFSCTG